MRTVKLDPNSEYSFKFMTKMSWSYPVERVPIRHGMRYEVEIDNVLYSLEYRTNKVYDVWKGNYKGKVMGSDLIAQLGYSLNPMKYCPGTL